MPIKNSKQMWTVGETVKVGFLSLTVHKVVATPGDFKPDAYILERANGFYTFVPHNGLNGPFATAALAQEAI